MGISFRGQNVRLDRRRNYRCSDKGFGGFLLKSKLWQTSGGAGGNIQDARINFQEWEKVNKILFELLGEFCGKPADVVEKDSTRDFWLSAEEAVAYGIIDEVIKSKK